MSRISACDRALRKDARWFEANPNRWIRVRPTVRGEYAGSDPNYHREWPLTLVVRTPAAKVERRPLQGNRDDIPDADQFMWAMWDEILAREAAGATGNLSIPPIEHARMLDEIGVFVSGFSKGKG